MQTIDYIILAIYIAVLCVISWIFRRVKKDSQDFFLAGRSLGMIPIGLSVMVTSFSAVNYLAMPGEIASQGLYMLASLPAFFLAAWPVAKYWMPRFLEMRPVSVYAFLEERFDGKVRLLCAVLFLAWRLFWMAVALYASCKIMHLLTGMGLLWLLAPRSMPLAALEEASDNDLDILREASIAPELSVISILSPVSPSGMGKTFRSLISARRSPSASAPVQTMLANRFPFSRSRLILHTP